MKIIILHDFRSYRQPVEEDFEMLHVLEYQIEINLNLSALSI